MEILFVALIGAALGGIARYALPRHDRYGVVLLPAVGASVASLLWVALTWLGLAWDAGLIWWISLLGAAIISAALAWVLGTRRQRHDETLFVELGGHGI